MDERAYRELVSNTLPHAVRSEEESDCYIAKIQELYERQSLTREEEGLAELLAILVEDFECRHYYLRRASCVEILREMMAANDLKPLDLVDVFGSCRVVSEVLSGKRQLLQTHINKLSRRFNISPLLFSPAGAGRGRQRPTS